MAGIAKGAHVLADFGDEVDGVQGEIVAHVLHLPTNESGGKFGIQRPDGKVEWMTKSDTHEGGGYFRYA